MVRVNGLTCDDIMYPKLTLQNVLCIPAEWCQI